MRDTILHRRLTVPLRLAIALSLLGGSAGLSTGQEPAPALDQKQKPRDCFRGQPLPECANFVITEVHYGGRLDKYDPRMENNYLTLELGLMVNRRPQSALGASLSHTWTEDKRLGFNFRYRRWLGHEFAVDLSPGFRLSARDLSTYTFDYPGFTARAGLMYADMVGLSVKMDVGKVVDRGNQVDWTMGIHSGAYASAGVSVIGLALIGVYAIALSDPDY